MARARFAMGVSAMVLFLAGLLAAVLGFGSPAGLFAFALASFVLWASDTK